jgi:hypothetical protein
MTSTPHRLLLSNKVVMAFHAFLQSPRTVCCITVKTDDPADGSPNLKPVTRTPKPENPRHKTRNPRPETRDPQAGTLNPTPKTRDTRHENRDLCPSPRNPKPQSSKPQTPNTKPQTQTETESRPLFEGFGFWDRRFGGLEV